MDDAPSELYKRQLLPTRNGYPLWIPEPFGHSAIYRTKGVRIGDMGYVTSEGGFVTLFNVRAPPDHPINSLGVPDGFERIQLDKFTSNHRSDALLFASPSMEMRGSGGIPISRSITKIQDDVEFHCRSNVGALLFLPNGASHVTCSADDKGRLREQVQKHALSWFEFALSNEELPGRSLYLITGIDKSSEWMIGTFHAAGSPTDQAAFRIQSILAAGNKSYVYSWGSSVKPISRTSPTISPSNSCRIDPARLQVDDEVFSGDAPLGQNQCLFIHGLTLTLNNANHVQSLSQCSQVVQDHDVVLRPMTGNTDLQPYHPAAVLNGFLLDKSPDANVAFSHDDDWETLAHDHENWPKNDVLLDRLQRLFSTYTSDASMGPSCASINARKSFQQMPLDIIKYLLQFIRVPDLLSFTQTCRSLYELTSDASVQYTIEVFFAGAEDFSYAYSSSELDALTKTTLPERLSLLRRREGAWRRLKPTSCEAVDMPPEANQWHSILSGGVFGLSLDSCAESTHTSALKYTVLSGSVPLLNATWNHFDLGADISSTAISLHDNDLIAAITFPPVPNKPGLVATDIHLIELSSGLSHPRASRPRISGPEIKSTPRSKGKIFGKFLAITFMFLDADDEPDRFLVFDWISGDLLLDYSAAESCVYRGIAFLSPNMVVISDTTSNHGMLRLWELAPVPRLLGTLSMPRLRWGMGYQMYDIHDEPGLTVNHSSLTHCQSVTRYNPREAIIAIYIILDSDQTIFVSRKSLLLEVAEQLRDLGLGPDDEPPTLEYREWGHTTRWIPIEGITAFVEELQGGQRVVAIRKDAKAGGSRLVVFDFNPHHIRKWADEAIDLDADVDLEEGSSMCTSTPSPQSPSQPRLFIKRGGSHTPHESLMASYEPSVDELPYVTYESQEVYQFTDVWTDGEWIAGVKMQRDQILSLDMLYFG